VGDRRTLVKGAWNVEPRSAAAPGPEGGQAGAGVGQFQGGEYRASGLRQLRETGFATLPAKTPE
jgi:hypothetical protein